jgi:hypothetical protein
MNNLMNNQIYLRRRAKIVVPATTASIGLSAPHIVAIQKNMESLGYTLSDEAVGAIRKLSVAEAAGLYTELIAGLKKAVGAHVSHKPMYPNFPNQVADASTTELYLNAELHYTGDMLGVRLMPEYHKQSRQALATDKPLKIINIGTVHDFEAILSTLVQSKVALSETDQADIAWFIAAYRDAVVHILPSEIPNKETMALVAAGLMRHTALSVAMVSRYAKTATDVLRIAAVLSDGDASLSASTRFKSLSKAERRTLLGIVEQSASATEDMLRYKEYWKRLGERLHPGDYAHRFPKAYAAISTLRNNLPYETFYGQYESLLLSRDVAGAVRLLATRPGELARRLDVLLRLGTETDTVLDAFAAAAPQVSNPVLLQVMTHFSHRADANELRVFFPKGNVARVQAIDNTLPILDEALCQRVAGICRDALRTKYAALPPLGKIYLDPELTRFTVPFALRSASRALHTLGRGSRSLLPAGDTVRFFMWWTDGKQRTDIDLSAFCLDAHSNHVSTISYYNLRDTGAYHSGDITSAPSGASEFIDLDIPVIRKCGIRYIMMSANSYTEQPFYDLPECFAGFMMRDKPQSGEIYEPRTVANKIDLTGDTRLAMPLMIDLDTREVIWLDLALRNNPQTDNNVHSNMSSMTLMSKAMLSLVKPSLYDLFSLHAEARGRLVTAAADADIIVGPSGTITPWDTEKIVGEYL